MSITNRTTVTQNVCNHINLESVILAMLASHCFLLFTSPAVISSSCMSAVWSAVESCWGDLLGERQSGILFFPHTINQLKRDWKEEEGGTGDKREWKKFVLALQITILNDDNKSGHALRWPFKLTLPDLAPAYLRIPPNISSTLLETYMVIILPPFYKSNSPFCKADLIGKRVNLKWKTCITDHTSYAIPVTLW